MTMQNLTLQEAETLAFEALTGAGASEMQARSLARAVAAAERDGITSHGLVYVPNYCEHLKCGKVVGSAEPVCAVNAPSAITVDAGCGFAHAAIDAGFAELIPAAQKQGCAALTIHNSYNCGVLGYHVERLTEAGLVGLGFTNAPASIAPLGGKIPAIGTNPFALAVPDGEGSAAVVIDQSASVVAKSEIMMKARAGEPIPQGWAIDAQGRDTADAQTALKGSMLPSGGYKGFGAGLMVELFASVLSGACLGIDASPFSGTAGGPPKTGQCFIALSPQCFSGEAFFSNLQKLCRHIETQEGARLPGSKRRNARTRSTQDGITVSQELLERIRESIVS